MAMNLLLHDRFQCRCLSAQYLRNQTNGFRLFYRRMSERKDIPELRLERTRIRRLMIGDDSESIEYWINTSTRERLQHIERLRRLNYGVRVPIDFKELLQIFNHRGVKYLLIGGYAVGLHGHVRATNDMDIVVAPDEENAEKVVAGLLTLVWRTRALRKTFSRPRKAWW